MKIFFRLCLFVFLPIVIILGLIFMLTGVDVKGTTFAIGVPVIFVLCIIAWLFSPSKPKAQQPTDGQPADGEVNQAPAKDAIDSQVNATADTQASESESLEKEKEQSLVKTVDEARVASVKGMIIGIGFFVFLLADVITATVLLINRVFVGAIVCAGIFAVLVCSIVFTMLIKSTKEEKTDVRYAKKIIGGKVKSCVMTDRVKKSNTSDTMMASSVVYNVVISAEDGREYTAMAERSYEPDEQIYFGVMNKKRAIIVDESEKDTIVLQKVWTKTTAGPNPRHHHHHHH